MRKCNKFDLFYSENNCTEINKIVKMYILYIVHSGTSEYSKLSMSDLSAKSSAASDFTLTAQAISLTPSSTRVRTLILLFLFNK